MRQNFDYHELGIDYKGLSRCRKNPRSNEYTQKDDCMSPNWKKLRDAILKGPFLCPKLCKMAFSMGFFAACFIFQHPGVV